MCINHYKPPVGSILVSSVSKQMSEGWFRSILPKAALRVEEEAWNAYPYTRTRYTCPFIEKFYLEIETKYCADGGIQDNVFNLSGTEKRNRIVDMIDVVKDDLPAHDYKLEEDPALYKSVKTGRGPLGQDWKQRCQDSPAQDIMCSYKLCLTKDLCGVLPCGTKLKYIFHYHLDSPAQDIMCSYKLCKVEFRYWGMQNKIEKFIHDVALRKTMLQAHRQAWCWQDESGPKEDHATGPQTGLVLAGRVRVSALRKTMLQAHRQAWCWQDEWEGLEIDDIRRLEKETQLALAHKMHRQDSSNSMDSTVSERDVQTSPAAPPASLHTTEEETDFQPADQDKSETSRANPPISSANGVETRNFYEWRFQSIMRDSENSSSDEEFFDAQDVLDETLLTKWSSEEMVAMEMVAMQPETPDKQQDKDDFIEMREGPREHAGIPSPRLEQRQRLPTNLQSSSQAGGPCGLLVLVLHGGSLLDQGSSILGSKQSDISTFHSTFESVIQAHFPSMAGQVSVQLVACPRACVEALSLLTSISPFSTEAASPHSKTRLLSKEHLPIGAVCLFVCLFSVSPFSTEAASPHSKTRLLSKEHLPIGAVCLFVCLFSVSPFSTEAASPHSKTRLLSKEHLPIGAVCLFVCLFSVSPFSTEAASPHSKTRLLSKEHLPIGAVCLFVCLFSVSPFSTEAASPHSKTRLLSKEHLPIGAVCLFVCFSVSPFSTEAASPHSKTRLLSKEHLPIGAVASPVGRQHRLPRARRHSHRPGQPGSSLEDSLAESDRGADGELSSPSWRHRSRFPSSPSGQDSDGSRGQFHLSYNSPDIPAPGDHPLKFEFEVGDFFLFGCPLSLILIMRQLTAGSDKKVCLAQPACNQVYNMFHLTDPLAARLEPLLQDQFSQIAPVSVSRYHKFPLGDGSTNLLVDAVQSHPSLFMSTLPLQPEERRPSEASVSSQTSQTSGQGDAIHYLASGELAIINQPINQSGQGDAIHYLASVTNRWWGAKRIDYALYCPEALTAFPSMTLPYLFHASYWESTDVIAFILRQVSRATPALFSYLFHACYQESTDAFILKQVVRVENVSIHIGDGKEVALFSPTQPRERWLKRRTAVKIKNMTANHRAADSVTLQNTSQSLTARFMYGPLDMVALTGEKVDVYIMLKPPAGEWVHFDTAVTNNHGRINYVVPQERMLGCGIYPVKMIVRGDHTSADSFLTVILPKTECVVFSIDGSFTASVSIMGKDPKVRAGAVDVVSVSIMGKDPKVRAGAVDVVSVSIMGKDPKVRAGAVDVVSISIMGKDPKVRAGAVDVVRHWQELGYLIVYVTGRPDMQKHQVVSWLAQHNFPHGVVSFCDGLSHDPLRQKANYLRNLVQEVEIVIHAAYGSVKDIPVYTSLGLESSRLFIVGRPNKKNQHQAQFINEGYAVHLSHLLHQPASLPAKGGAAMVLHKGCFGLPGQAKGMIRPMAGRQAAIPPGTAAAPSSAEKTVGYADD
uniref:DDHD domain-containing protein n=1 Tax=Branchiostoma floridae TaxID=7739 RepID=C3ZL65_BRAFL|eukprot:XP_002590736.1 hypothetical protein BRAFLDRAFT_78151 [Branchiostoma floridae]